VESRGIHVGGVVPERAVVEFRAGADGGGGSDKCVDASNDENQ
jgi:hypothetical protein